MKKGEIIEIAQAMSFHLDLDSTEKGWLRFQLADELDQLELRWIWYLDESDAINIRRGANILFKAGQKAKIQQINQFISLK